LAVHLNQTLESLDQASQTLGELADNLHRNPAALMRPAEHFTPRVYPCHSELAVPLECSAIKWQR